MTAPAPPEHTIVDPCAAITEYYKSLLPADASPPVFSTMALEHGENAVGAKSLRPGFAFNEQMDLAWALGFPYMRFVIDGFPAEDSKAALLDTYDPDGFMAKRRRAKWRHVSGKVTIALPRRGAVAVVHEGARTKNPFQLSDDEFMSATSTRDMTQDEITMVFRDRASQGPDPETIHLFLEALLGPDMVVEALMSLIEDPPESPFGNQPAVKAVYALIPLCRRLLPDHFADVTARLTDQLQRLHAQGQPMDGEERVAWSNLAGALRVLLHPAEMARSHLNAGTGRYGLLAAKWVDDDRELTSACLENESDVPNVPESRYCFTGSDRVLSLEVQRFPHYDARDVLQKYVNEYTTIDASPLLVPILRLLGTQDASPMLRAWLKSRAPRVAPELERLTQGSDDVADLAERATKLLA
jgi:hypothetical protein